MTAVLGVVLMMVGLAVVVCLCMGDDLWGRTSLDRHAADALALAARPVPPPAPVSDRDLAGLGEMWADPAWTGPDWLRHPVPVVVGADIAADWVCGSCQDHGGEAGHHCRDRELCTCECNYEESAP